MSGGGHEAVSCIRRVAHRAHRPLSLHRSRRHTLVADVVRWGRVVVIGLTGAPLATCVLSGPGRPDLSVVDVVARWQLAARRLGGSIRLVDVSPELAELLDLSGLGRQVGGQAEGGEQLLGVEEGVQPGDPVA